MRDENPVFCFVNTILMNISTLRKYSLTYLLIPNILFVLGWFKPLYSIPVAIALVGLFTLQLRRKEAYSSFHIPGSRIWLFLGMAAFWTFCTGTGGLSYQIADYWMHNAKYDDLFKNPWPIYFPGKEQYACYYFGYFIPPAAISKLLGQLSVEALLLWTVAGYWLALLWLYLLLKKRVILVVLLLFLGGVGHLAKVAFYLVFTQYSYNNPPFYSEIWALFDQSRWVTNQIIPILLLSSILVYDFFIRKNPADSFFPITLGFIWAIFPSIVFVLLFAVMFVRSYFYDRYPWLTVRTMAPVIVAGLAFLPTFLFLSSSDSTPIHGFIWQFEPLGEIMAEYFVGVLIDLILFFLILRELKNVDDLIPRWFVMAALLMFFLISLYRIGYWNDWFIRGYNPLMCIVLLGILRSLDHLYEAGKWKKTFYFNAVLAVMSLGVVLPVSHIGKSLKQNVIVADLFPERYPFSPLPYDGYQNTYEALLFNTHSGELEANQYLSRKGSFFERHLSRRISEQPGP